MNQSVEDIYTNHMTTNMSNKKQAKEIFNIFAANLNYDHIFVSPKQVIVYISDSPLSMKKILSIENIEAMQKMGWKLQQVESTNRTVSVLAAIFGKVQQ